MLDATERFKLKEVFLKNGGNIPLQPGDESVKVNSEVLLQHFCVWRFCVDILDLFKAMYFLNL